MVREKEGMSVDNVTKYLWLFNGRCEVFVIDQITEEYWQTTKGFYIEQKKEIVFKRKDGTVREVVVKTQSGIYKHPAVKICKLIAMTKQEKEKYHEKMKWCNFIRKGTKFTLKFAALSEICD